MEVKYILKNVAQFVAQKILQQDETFFAYDLQRLVAWDAQGRKN